MSLEVASQLFELYLSLADIQRFWSSILGRWVSCPLPLPFPLHHLPPPSLHLSPPSPAPLPCSLVSSRRALEQEALMGTP